MIKRIYLDRWTFEISHFVRNDSWFPHLSSRPKGEISNRPLYTKEVQNPQRITVFGITNRKRQSERLGSAAFLAGLCTVFVCACKPANKSPELPNWRSGYEEDASAGDDGGAVDESDGGNVAPRDFPEDSFGIAIPNNVTYPIRLYLLNTEDTPCAVKQGDSINADIQCMMDMDEDDLFFSGLTYDIVAPKGMCDFVSYSSYMFQNFPTVVGPAEVSWTVEENGTYTDEVNASNGKPRCDYDFSLRYPESARAPNCCEGSYTQTITDAKSGKTSVSTGDWNGKLSECYHGAAYLDKEARFSDDGWPADTIFYTDRKAFLHTVGYKGLSDKYGGDILHCDEEERGLNILLANYYDPADHNMSKPAAFNTDSVLQRSVLQPYYEFLCLDDATEIIARVRLVVREWNEEAQFDIRGNPDTEGCEPVWNAPINDEFDWKDQTPGDSDYPKVLPVERH
jgi:hypothetical protein